MSYKLKGKLCWNVTRDAGNYSKTHRQQETGACIDSNWCLTKSRIQNIAVVMQSFIETRS